MSHPRPAPAGANRHYRRWTPRDDERLRLAWGEGTLEAVALRLGRSVTTTYWRARKLGLPCGVPQGFEALTDAAKRCGFDTGQLRAILATAKVPLRRAFARPRSSSKTGRTFHYVSPDAVDRAVARWAGTEVVHPAAVARGLDGATLRRWLVQAGYKPPTGPKRRWRVATAIIDAVVAANRALLSVRAHAKRVRLSRAVLAAKLRAAGVLGPKRPGVEVRFSVEVVDAALRQHLKRQASGADRVAASGRGRVGYGDDGERREGQAWRRRVRDRGCRWRARRGVVAAMAGGRSRGRGTALAGAVAWRVDRRGNT